MSKNKTIQKTTVMMLSIITIMCIMMTVSASAQAYIDGEGVETLSMVEISEGQTVADIASAIQTALSDENSNTVVVTGSKTNVTSSLYFYIPEGKTVVWRAIFKGAATDCLMRLNGKGVFEVAEGGEIDASSGDAIATETSYINYDIPSITVSGGAVKAVEGRAIFIYSSTLESSAVTISGGVVSNAWTGGNPTIHILGNNNIDITIKNEGEVLSTGNYGIAVQSSGNVKIQDNAKVIAGRTAVIGKSITVEGGTISAVDFTILSLGKSSTTIIQGGSVESTGSEGCSISAEGDVLVSGGMVSATGGNGTAISSLRSSTIVVEGGTVSAKKTAIQLSGGSLLVRGGLVRGGNNVINAISGGSVSVEDGKVEATDSSGSAIFARDVLIRGGTVSANNDNGIAINSVGDVLIEGGLVSANKGNGIAVRASTPNSFVTIVNGIVEATGTGGNAIFAQDGGGMLVSGGSITGSTAIRFSARSNVAMTISGGTVSAEKTAILFSGGSLLVHDGIIRGGNEGIYASGFGSVTVEGGKVEATNTGGIGIYAELDVLIKGGIVSANEENGTAVKAGGSLSRLTIEKGMLEAMGTGGTAIFAEYITGMLVSGGNINAGNIAIDFFGNDYTIIISGGTINGGRIGIRSKSFLNPVITVSGGKIIGGSNAIRLETKRNPAITITGGMVLGCGSKYSIDHDNASIYMEIGVPTVTSPGTVVAWDKSMGNRLYGLHTATDLASLPESVAKWRRISGKNGIFYGLDGFFEIDDVSVAEITADATGLDGLKVGKAVDATITYTLTGGSYATDLESIDLDPSGLPEWLSIMNTVIESTTVRVSLSGTPDRVSEPLTLTLPEALSAVNLMGGTDGVPIPVKGTVYIGAVAKGDGVDIADLEVDEITATDVTLRPIAGLPNGQRAEYAVSETASQPSSAVWQDSISFSGLFPNTEYYAFVRSKEDEHYSSGAASGGVRFKTAKAELSGSVSVSGSPVYGATLTAVTTSLHSVTPGVSPDKLGSFSYQWWRRSSDGVVGTMIPSATSSSYTIAEADVGQIIWIEVKAANCIGTVNGSINKPTEKAMPAGTPTYTEIIQAGQTLADAELKGSFLNPHNDTSVPGILSWNVPSNTLVQRGKAYRWTFMAAEEACFHTVYGSMILWPAADKNVRSNDENPPASNAASDKVPNQPVTVTTLIPATVDADGTANANISDKAITDSIAKAQTDAKVQGRTSNGIALELDVAMPKDTTALSVSLSRNALQSLVSTGVTSLTISGSPVKVTFDMKALQEILEQSNETINISIGPPAKLSNSAKKIIGIRPVYNLTMGYGSGKTVSGFDSGSVSVEIPYNLGANEKSGNVQAVYVDVEGDAHWVLSSVYDSVSNVLRFSTNYFSAYGVGYKQDVPDFTDIGSHWAKEDIQFVVNSGLLRGTSDTAFSPNSAMTRGMFVTAIGRLAKTDVRTYEHSSFTDVKSDAYYMGHIEWASKNNIVNGIGDEKFAPDHPITREQMAVIMQNYAKAIGFVFQEVHAENAFADNIKINDYAKDAVKQMQMAGVINGKNGNVFDPRGTATRAEVSAVLRRFLELSISISTTVTNSDM